MAKKQIDKFIAGMGKTEIKVVVQLLLKEGRKKKTTKNKKK